MAELKAVRTGAGRAAGNPWLAGLMALSLGLVVIVGLWDQEREAEASLAELEKRQTAFATLVASVITARLDVVRADAIALAADDPTSDARPLLGRWRYEGLRVVSANASRPPAAAGRLGLSVPVSGHRWVDMNVPIAPFLADLSIEEGQWVALRPPNEHAFLVSSGRQLDPDLLGPLADRPGARRLTREQAAALGLPRRVAVAGASRIDAGPLGQWDVVVAMSLAAERDRQTRARWRILFGVALAGGLVLAFGWYALRAERKELGLLQELTLAEQEQEREEQLEHQGRAATMLTFATSVAHEISTPLGVIHGRAEQLLGRFADDARGANAAQRILDQTDRIDSVIRGFLRLARGASPALERLDPAEIAEDAATLVEHRFTRAGVGLETEARAGGPTIRGDRRLLEHALVNLMLNACGACERGGSVRLALHHDATSVQFEVEDDGVGVGPDLMAHVREPFLSTKAPRLGAELGLTIANEIVKIHRGALALAPRRPRGTTAVLCVPVATLGSGEARGPARR